MVPAWTLPARRLSTGLSNPTSPHSSHPFERSCWKSEAVDTIHWKQARLFQTKTAFVLFSVLHGTVPLERDPLPHPHHTLPTHPPPMGSAPMSADAKRTHRRHRHVNLPHCVQNVGGRIAEGPTHPPLVQPPVNHHLLWRAVLDLKKKTKHFDSKIGGTLLLPPREEQDGIQTQTHTPK